MGCHPPVASAGEAGKASEGSGGQPPAAQQPEQGRKTLASGQTHPSWGDQVHRGHAISRREIREEGVGLGALQRDRPQPPVAIEAQ